MKGRCYNPNDKRYNSYGARGIKRKVKKEILDWYTSLGAIRTKTSDELPASVVVDIALGYKKEDKATSTEITQRTIELKDFLRDFDPKQEKARRKAEIKRLKYPNLV